MGQEHYEYLKRTQASALDQCNERLKQWDTFEKDYNSLKQLLLKVSHKVTHEVMVPIGSLALMPGQLVHTNEVMVLLGDNWFSTRSTQQAQEIVDRRLKQCEKMKEDLMSEKKQIQNWMKYTEEVGGNNNFIEIREEYDPEKEEKWRAKHRENVREYHQKKKSENCEEKSEDVWALLEELEKEERSGVQDAGVSAQEQTDEASTSNSSRKIRWQDQSMECITFSHSNSDDNRRRESKNKQVTEKINSPGDISRLFEDACGDIPAKSILKTTKNKETVSKTKKFVYKESNDSVPSKAKKELNISSDQMEAFTGSVVEKSIDVLESTNVSVTGRPVSKFKSKRLQKN